MYGGGALRELGVARQTALTIDHQQLLQLVCLLASIVQVVSIPGICLVTFITELNGLELWSTNIGNAYLELVTKEKVALVEGPEFGEYEGHTFIILKAQYGLKSSGRHWHDRLHDAIKLMGFVPTKPRRTYGCKMQVTTTNT